jgi:(2Fe-2S) ferredoxin
MTETTSPTLFDVPQVFKRHVFACYTQRPVGHPRGSCGEQGAQPLWDRLSKQIEAQRLSDVGFTAAGCLGFCRAGPLLVVYPEGVWYAPKSADDVDEIVENHLKGGALVERLVIVPQR